MSDTSNDLSPQLGGQKSPPGDEPALTGDRALLHALEMLSALPTRPVTPPMP